MLAHSKRFGSPFSSRLSVPLILHFGPGALATGRISPSARRISGPSPEAPEPAWRRAARAVDVVFGVPARVSLLFVGNALFPLSPVLGGEGRGEGLGRLFDALVVVQALACTTREEEAPHPIPLPRVRGRGDQSHRWNQALHPADASVSGGSWWGTGPPLSSARRRGWECPRSLRTRRRRVT